MKRLQPASYATRGDAELGTVVSALFRRWPGLLGFAVQEEGELYLTDVVLHPWFDEGQRTSLCSAIAVALSELVDEEPAARGLLSGRTFARTLH